MEEKPLFTIALIVKEFAYLASLTLDSIIKQKFQSYEVVIVEVGAEQNMLRIIESYENQKIEVYHEKDGNLASMMNKVVTFAKGKYIQFFYPGDQFLSNRSLQTASEIIGARDDIDLFYGTQLERSGKYPEIAHQNLSLELLQEGKVPSRLHSCWFSTKMLSEEGNFDTRYPYRAAFDMFCRIYKKSPEKLVHFGRVFVDYEYRRVSPHITLRYVVETYSLLFRHFGFKKAVVWWFVQDRIVITKWLFNKLKQIFWRA